MPLTLALTDSLGYANRAAAEAAGWAVQPGGGRVILTFGELVTVDGQNPSMLVTVDGAFGVGGTTFRMSRTFQMAANSLVGASVANLRVGAPWFDWLAIRLTTSAGAAAGRAENGLISTMTGADGIATVTIEKDPGGSYSHVNEKYYFANMRLYGTLVGDLPPTPPPSLLPLLVFTPDMDWMQPLVEELQCETTITRAYKDVEQRQGLLDVPNRRLSYLVTTGRARESALVEALIEGGQARHWWVPYWRSAQFLPAATTIGQTTLAIDTRHKGYDPDQGVMFWRDPFHAEVAELSGVTDSLLTFAPLTAVWASSGPTRAKVVPVARGLLAPSETLDYIERSIKQTTVTFDLLS